MKHKKINKKYIYKDLGVIRFIEKSRNWELDAGLKFGGDKKYRKRFKTLEEAKVHAQKLLIRLKNDGLNGFKLSSAEQLDATNAYEIISGLNVNLVQTAKFYKDCLNQNGSSMSVSDLIDDFLERKSNDREKGEGVRDRTISDYRSRYKRLKSEIGHVQLIEFSHIKHWEPLSKKFGTASRKQENYIRMLFNYAVERDYIKSSPMKGKLSAAPVLKKPKVLADKQWQKLFHVAIETEDELGLLAYVVLTTVMGIRPESEVRNLSWDEIDLNRREIFIGDDQTGKNQLGRTLDIPEFAVELLLRCKSRHGSIIPSVRMFNKRWEKLRVLAGFIIKDENGKTIRNDWSHDVARHTAATMHYGFYKSKEKVSEFLGHTNKQTMRYYVNHANGIGEEAKRFYSFKADDNQLEDLKTVVA